MVLWRITPEGLQTVARGCSAAETPGTIRKEYCILKGCESDHVVHCYSRIPSGCGSILHEECANKRSLESTLSVLSARGAGCL
jgi:hypothetical protein